MKKIFENWRSYKKELLTEDKTLKGSISIASDTGWEDPKTNRLAYIHHQKAEAARGAFIRTTILNKRKKLERAIAKQLSLIKDQTRLPIPSIIVDNIIKFVESTKIRFTNTASSLRGGGQAAYYSTYNMIVFYKLETVWAKKPDRFNRVVYHELGHALDRGIAKELKKIGDAGFSDLVVNFAESMMTHYGRRIPPEWYLVGSMGAGAFAGSAGDRIKKKTEKFDPWERAGWESKEGKMYSVEVVDKIRSITLPGIVSHQRFSSTGDRRAYAKHKELVTEFFASFKELTVVLGRDLLPIDIEVYCAHKNSLSGGKDIPGRLVQDWTSTVEMIKDIRDTPEGSPMRRRWQKIYKRVLKTETMSMLDCGKGPNFIAKVLNELI